MKLFILYILLIGITIQKYLILDIKKDNEKQFQIINNNNFVKDEEIMEILFYNNIFTLINVGRPKKEVQFFLVFDTDKTILNTNEYSKFRSISYKYNNITNESIDLFEFNDNYKINSYSFYLINDTEKNNKNKYSIIGLKPQNINPDINNNTNFLNQLQKDGLINKRVFSLIYNENKRFENILKKQILLIGALPEEYNLNYYSKNKVRWAKISKNYKNNGQNWKIKIDSFGSNFNLTYFYNTYIEFVLEYNLIIGPDDFRIYLLDNIIGSLIDKKVCKEDYFYSENLETSYIFYVCNQLEDFKNKILYFKNKELNETFEIKLDELFYRYNRKLFFGMIFDGDIKKDKKEKNVWKMGKIFYDKYSFVFDDENKLIGYYKIEKETENPYIILICFIIFFCFIIVLFIIGQNLRKNKNINNLDNKKKTNNIINENLKEKID